MCICPSFAVLLDLFATINDSWVKCAFVAGLPDELKRQLKAASSLEVMTLEEVVDRTRSLANVQETCCAVGIPKERRTGVVNRVLTCYNCRKPGHLARDCVNGVCAKQRQVAVNMARVCYNCQKPGHLARNCVDAGRQQQNRSLAH